MPEFILLWQGLLTAECKPVRPVFAFNGALFCWKGRISCSGQAGTGSPTPLFPAVSGLPMGQGLALGPCTDTFKCKDPVSARKTTCTSHLHLLGPLRYTATHITPFPPFSLQVLITPLHIRETYATVKRRYQGLNSRQTALKDPELVAQLPQRAKPLIPFSPVPGFPDEPC